MTPLLTVALIVGTAYGLYFIRYHLFRWIIRKRWGKVAEGRRLRELKEAAFPMTGIPMIDDALWRPGKEKLPDGEHGAQQGYVTRLSTRDMTRAVHNALTNREAMLDAMDSEIGEYT